MLLNCCRLSPPALLESKRMGAAASLVQLLACLQEPHEIVAYRLHLAMTKSSLTMREPSPMYFCTSSLPDTRMKVQSV